MANITEEKNDFYEWVKTKDISLSTFISLSVQEIIDLVQTWRKETDHDNE